MTIHQIAHEAHQQLAGKYPEREIDSFVRILFKHYCTFGGICNAAAERSEVFVMPENKEIAGQALNDARLQKLGQARNDAIRSAIAELKNFRPIQYILGETEFYGLPFEVNPDVLIPRPETEELVDWIVREYDKSAALSIVDIGAGSGCIAVSLKTTFHNSTVWAVDVSEQALSVAKRNAAKNNVEVNFLLRDALKDGMMGFERDSLDVVVSNPPYVTASDAQQMLPNVLEYEPHIALFTPENDPLAFFKRIAAFGKECLKKGGMIFFEINETLHEEVAEVLKQYDFYDISPRRDINGKWRMVSARKIE